MNSHIIAPDGGFITGSRAVNVSNLTLCSFRLHTHDIADFLHCFRIAHRTGIDRSPALHDGCRHCVAACVTAGSAVITRKTFSYKADALVGLHCKLLADCHQSYADQKSDYAYYQCRYKNFLHILLRMTAPDRQIP